ncbi:hypothetical protein QMK19_16905 [Streptomyces sp. H10-C2]|uniref:hypothetical protein n=1 Tax=unclassified Streptomyces TaxID=2593676 RepID=UPI0024BB1BC3|nr:MULTISPECIES: hypothetical protein [unclassified Streptomyces]MDJ0341582.1 hypothetical protein [Streptomyces sp. PH10-H1]MDJ0371316.1 hypothetical protein [Streptomyces sp. H10-C2]
MPLIPEEPQIHESVPGPRSTPAAGRSASTPRPVPGPRPTPRPAPPRGGYAPNAGPGRPGPARGPATTASATVTAAPPPAPRSPGETGAAVATAQIQLIPASAGGAIDAADEAVDLLLDTGRAPGEILVLTTGDHHPWAAHELSFGDASYWSQHDAGDDVFYAGITAERAAGRPVVVVAVNGGTDGTTALGLPTALARAGTLLIVCGDHGLIDGPLAEKA